MDTIWLEDYRKIPDNVMCYIRIMAVNAVRVLGQSPEIVAKVYKKMMADIAFEDDTCHLSGSGETGTPAS